MPYPHPLSPTRPPNRDPRSTHAGHEALAHADQAPSDLPTTGSTPCPSGHCAEPRHAVPSRPVPSRPVPTEEHTMSMRPPLLPAPVRHRREDQHMPMSRR